MDNKNINYYGIVILYELIEVNLNYNINIIFYLTNSTHVERNNGVKLKI